MIWQLALFDRPRLVEKKCGCLSEPEKPRLCLPALCLVCTEARDVALRSQRLYTIQCIHPLPGNRVRVHRATSSVWFNPNADVLFHKDECKLHMAEAAAKRVFVEISFPRFVTARVQGLISHFKTGYLHLKLSLEMPGEYRRLKTLYVGSCLSLGSVLTTDTLSKLFGGERHLVLDVEDTSSVERFTRIVGSDPSFERMDSRKRLSSAKQEAALVWEELRQSGAFIARASAELRTPAMRKSAEDKARPHLWKIFELGNNPNEDLCKLLDFMKTVEIRVARK